MPLFGPESEPAEEADDAAPPSCGLWASFDCLEAHLAQFHAEAVARELSGGGLMVKAPEYTLEPNEPSENSALAAALDWSKQGWPTFPLRRNDKAPAIPNVHRNEKDASGKPIKCDGRCGKFGHGVLDASRSTDTLGRLFGSHSTGNVGGAATDRVIFDFDVQHDAERLDVFPPTREHLSGRGNGNVHLVYRVGGSLARQIKPGVNVLGKGIDIRAGAGSYVVLPPSRIRRSRSTC